MTLDESQEAKKRRVPRRDAWATARPKVTATFFNAKYIKKSLVEGIRVMLSGEVGYYKGTMQLTHPAFLMLNPQGKGSPIAGERSPRPPETTSVRTGDVGVRA